MICYLSHIKVDMYEQHRSLFQLTHHFVLGNMSGKQLDKGIYRNSTTQQDFDEKGILKVGIFPCSRPLHKYLQIKQ